MAFAILGPLFVCCFFLTEIKVILKWVLFVDCCQVLFILYYTCNTSAFCLSRLNKGYLYLEGFPTISTYCQWYFCCPCLIVIFSVIWSTCNCKIASTLGYWVWILEMKMVFILIVVTYSSSCPFLIIHLSVTEWNCKYRTRYLCLSM